MMDRERYNLRLYVAGSTPRSMLAVKNIRNICDRHLAGLYDLEVIDIYQQPELAAGAQIIAAPTLIKLTPEPARRAIGDLSNEHKVLTTLSLPIRDPDER
jgi:circadian clock protein KaiB